MKNEIKKVRKLLLFFLILLIFIFFILLFNNKNLNTVSSFIFNNNLNLDDSNYDVTFYGDLTKEEKKDYISIADHVDTVYNQVRLGHLVTINGVQLSDYDNLQGKINATFRIDNIKVGKEAYKILKEKNSSIAKPKNGMEYIIITVSVLYNEGEVEYLDLSQNIARLQCYFMDFTIDGAESFTKYFYDPNNEDFNFDVKIKKGEEKKVNLAFLLNKDNKNQLVFEGFSNIIKFNLTK